MDSILIDHLKIYAYHGVLPEEKEMGQYFYVTAVLSLPLHRAADNDDLSQSVNYADVCHKITSFIQAHCFDLIETAAEGTVDMLFSTYPELSEVTFTVEKPSAPIGLPLHTVAVTITRKRHTAYIALGSNMGDKKQYLTCALSDLEADPRCHVVKTSDFLTTAPYGPVIQEDFLNACAEVETWLNAEDFLSLLLRIEKQHGRERLIHWGPRTLDLDLLLFDDSICSTAFLTLPHPELHKRRFVLEPLKQIAPFALHPLIGKRVAELYELLPEETR